jgi:hypothetical protein
MHRVAESLVAHEPAHGTSSVFVNLMDAATWEAAVDADIHVCHTHVPDSFKKRCTKPFRVVYVGHGTPEHVYQSAVEEGTRGSYGHADGWMLLQRWLQVADARVTFWPRHQAIYQSLCDRGSVVHCVPMGVDTAFWAGGTTRGKYDGAPSVWTGENQHYIKWILDLILAWPWVTADDAMPDARLHAVYLPKDQHRWLFSLANRNGASYKAHLSPIVFPHEQLRDIFKSVDFIIGLVRYGDLNHLSLQANAAGATTISYAGNPYADYWLPEGDQRTLATELVKVLRGETPKRVKSPVPDIAETAAAMVEVYKGVLS